MEKRINISGNAPWEKIYGYSRAVKLYNNIYLSGTTATNEQGELIGINDPYRQTKQIYQNIKTTLEKAGATLNNIVRVRIFVVDLNHTEEIMKAHREFFEKICPAATLVQVAGLISKEMLLEIEAEAVI